MHTNKRITIYRNFIPGNALNFKIMKNIKYLLLALLTLQFSAGFFSVFA